MRKAQGRIILRLIDLRLKSGSKISGLRRDSFAYCLRPHALIAISVNRGDLIEILFAHLHALIAERSGLVQFRIEFDPFFRRSAFVFGAVDIVTNDVWFGVERPKEADDTIDRSDRDRLRRRGRECVFRRVVVRLAVIALDRVVQTGLAGRKRQGSHYILIIGAELEVTVNETRLAQRLWIYPI